MASLLARLGLGRLLSLVPGVTRGLCMLECFSRGLAASIMVFQNAELAGLIVCVLFWPASTMREQTSLYNQ